MTITSQISLKFDNARKEEKEETKRGTALSVPQVGLWVVCYRQVNSPDADIVVRVRSGRGGGDGG